MAKGFAWFLLVTLLLCSLIWNAITTCIITFKPPQVAHTCTSAVEENMSTSTTDKTTTRTKTTDTLMTAEAPTPIDTLLTKDKLVEADNTQIDSNII